MVTPTIQDVKPKKISEIENIRNSLETSLSQGVETANQGLSVPKERPSLDEIVGDYKVSSRSNEKLEVPERSRPSLESIVGDYKVSEKTPNLNFIDSQISEKTGLKFSEKLSNRAKNIGEVFSEAGDPIGKSYFQSVREGVEAPLQIAGEAGGVVNDAFMAVATPVLGSVDNLVEAIPLVGDVYKYGKKKGLEGFMYALNAKTFGEKSNAEVIADAWDTLDSGTKKDLESVLNVVSAIPIAGQSVNLAKLIQKAGVSGIAKGVVSVPARAARVGYDAGASLLSGTGEALSSGFKKGVPMISKDLTDDAVVLANTAKSASNREANKVATEILQVGKKATATRKQEFSNAAIQARNAIAKSNKDIKTYHEMADMFEETGLQSHDEVLKIVSGSSDDVGVSYLGKIQKTIDDLRSDPQFAEYADIYEDVLNREKAWIKSVGKVTPSVLQKRKQELGKRVGKLYETGVKKDLPPEISSRIEALDEIRGGAQETIGEIFPETIPLNKQSSGLIDAANLARVQRERANNALSDPYFRDLWATDKVKALMWIKERAPVLKNFGINNLTKLDTKSDILESILPAKINQIRRIGVSTDEMLPESGLLLSPKNQLPRTGESSKVPSQLGSVRKEPIKVPSPTTIPQSKVKVKNGGYMDLGEVGKSLGVSDDLMKEARKYKNVEEFVKAQGEPVYHGSKKEISGALKPGVKGSRDAGIYVTPYKNQASRYGNLNEVFIDKNAKVFDFDSLSGEQIGNDIEKYFIKNKIPFTNENGFIYSDLGNFDIQAKSKRFLDTILKNVGEKKFFQGLGYGAAKFGEGETQIVIYNPEIAKTKLQLTYIWNKANKSK